MIFKVIGLEPVICRQVELTIQEDPNLYKLEVMN